VWHPILCQCYQKVKSRWLNISALDNTVYLSNWSATRFDLNSVIFRPLIFKKTHWGRQYMITSLIPGFQCDVDKICALPRYFTTSSGNSLSTFRDNLSVPTSKVKQPQSWIYWPFKTEPMGCPETSVKDYHSTMRNNPEECRCYIIMLLMLPLWSNITRWMRMRRRRRTAGINQRVSDRGTPNVWLWLVLLQSKRLQVPMHGDLVGRQC
jgi:hypothetical protein